MLLLASITNSMRVRGGWDDGPWAWPAAAQVSRAVATRERIIHGTAKGMPNVRRADEAAPPFTGAVAGPLSGRLGTAAVVISSRPRFPPVGPGPAPAAHRWG